MSFGSPDWERENDCWNASLSSGSRQVLAAQEYAYNAGMDRPTEEFIITSWDTIERNPHYTGETNTGNMDPDPNGCGGDHDFDINQANFERANKELLQR